MCAGAHTHTHSMMNNLYTLCLSELKGMCGICILLPKLSLRKCYSAFTVLKFFAQYKHHPNLLTSMTYFLPGERSLGLYSIICT